MPASFFFSDRIRWNRRLRTLVVRMNEKIHVWRSLERIQASVFATCPTFDPIFGFEWRVRTLLFPPSWGKKWKHGLSFRQWEVEEWSQQKKYRCHRGWTRTLAFVLRPYWRQKLLSMTGMARKTRAFRETLHPAELLPPLWKLGTKSNQTEANQSVPTRIRPNHPGLRRTTWDDTKRKNEGGNGRP